MIDLINSVAIYVLLISVTLFLINQSFSDTSINRVYIVNQSKVFYIEITMVVSFVVVLLTSLTYLSASVWYTIFSLSTYGTMTAILANFYYNVKCNRLKDKEGGFDVRDKLLFSIETTQILIGMTLTTSLINTGIKIWYL